MGPIRLLGVAILIAMSSAQAQAESPLAAQARALVTKLPTETWLFHWQPRSALGFANTGIVAPHDPKLAQYLSATSLRTWGDVPSQAIMGNGLYLATDPISSRTYGGDQWAMVAVPIKAGTAYLDVRKTADLMLTPESLRFLAQSGCTTPTTLRRVMEWGAEDACHKAALALMKELGVNLLAYTWISAPIDYCDARTSTAFMAASPDVIDLGQTFVLVADTSTPDAAAGARELIQELYIHSTDFNATPLPWPALAEPAAENANAQSWARTNLFGCANADASLPDRSTPMLVARFAKIRARALEVSARVGHAVDPMHLIDVAARRFINRPDWEGFVATGGWDPRLPYGALTWNQWWQVATSEVEKVIDAKTPLSFEMLAAWDKDAVMNTIDPSIVLGDLKQYQNFGNNLTEADAVTQDEINALSSVFLPDKPGQPFLKWIPLYCQEELKGVLGDNVKLPLSDSGADCAKIVDFAKQWVEQHSGLDDYWTKTKTALDQGLIQGQWYAYACWPPLSDSDAASREKECGEIAYPDPAQVDIRAELDLIIEKVNKFFSAATPGDALSFALEVQRQYVGLHPFNKGNGRTSRWIMDYITLRSGLPPVLVRNMDFDLSTWPPEYEIQGRAGASEAMDIMDRCLDQYSGVKNDSDYMALQMTTCGLLE